MVSPLSICREWTNITTPPKGLWRKLGMYTSTLHCELLGKKEINVLEIGFGTGLNTFLTFLESQEKGLRINYTTFELYPLSPDITEKLNYPALIAPSSESIFALFTSMRMESKDRYITLVFLIQTPCRPHSNLSRRNIRRGLFRCVRSPKSNPKCGTRKFSGRFSITCLRVVF